MRCNGINDWVPSSRSGLNNLTNILTFRSRESCVKLGLLIDGIYRDSGIYGESVFISSDLDFRSIIKYVVPGTNAKLQNLELLELTELISIVSP